VIQRRVENTIRRLKEIATALILAWRCKGLNKNRKKLGYLAHLSSTVAYPPKSRDNKSTWLHNDPPGQLFA
jgi:hypothetical protein